MRLLHFNGTGQLQLTHDLRKDVPPYAILSHRWMNDKDEVNFLDITNGEQRNKIGWAKLWFCGEQARKDNLKYFWVDTCCIDKSDARELSRAITSMFKWYADAEHCYVYLADVTAQGPNQKSKHNTTGQRRDRAFRRSQWFTRGWTLQELLAPSKVSFFSYEGDCLGTRQTLAETIQSITGINREALDGKALHEFSEAERFRWAMTRHTTEPEDQAYCLLGIFGVTMPPHYGEGEDNAYDRLKEAISKKHHNDLMRLEVKHSKVVEPDDLTDDQDDYRINPCYASSITTDTTRHTRSFMTATSQQSFATSLGVLDVPGPATSRIRRSVITKFLRFDAMNARRSEIKLPLDDTCRWILEHAAYKAWLEPRQLQDSFLWIKGHPGAGKSTIMKFLGLPSGRACWTYL